MKLAQAMSRGSDALRTECDSGDKARYASNMEAARLLEHIVARECSICKTVSPCEQHQVLSLLDVFPSYDPFENEKTEYTLEQFTKVAVAELLKHWKEWDGANDFHKGAHTWVEWWNVFDRYMSW